MADSESGVAESNPIPVWTFDLEHERKHAQWAWDTNQESLAWCLDGLIDEIERLRIALEAAAFNLRNCHQQEACVHITEARDDANKAIGRWPI